MIAAAVGAAASAPAAALRCMSRTGAGAGLQTLDGGHRRTGGGGPQDAGACRRCSRRSTAHTPQVFVDIDRVSAEMLGVPIENVFETLRIYLGSAYVNDFNIFGRTYRGHRAGRRCRFRIDQAPTSRNLKTRNATGDMVPLG